MMDYQLLSKYKYNDSGAIRSVEAVEREYQERLNGYSTVVSRLVPTLDIDLYAQVAKYPLFFVQTTSLLALVNKIFRHSAEIQDLSNTLPGVASEIYRRNLLTQEVYYTNKIEGVDVTKHEISTIIGDLDSKQAPQKRLTSTVRLYNSTTSGRVVSIHDLTDIRHIYDQLLDGEIPDSKLPDGQHFRKQPVYIGDELKKVHTPPRTESEIQESIISLIKFMNNDDILDVIKAIVSHFMFENTHPFYDGNGRTGRYLLSTYLAAKFDTYTGLSISTAIRAEQNRYYRAFKQADDYQNRADLTLFITQMLTIIVQGQQDVIQNLRVLTEQLDAAATRLHQQLSDDIQWTVAFVFAQSALFTEDAITGVKDTELVEFLFNDDPKRYHKVSVRRPIQELETQGVLHMIKERPLQHVIDDALIQK
ncbi:Fic family protein [Secundilactobacillus paracollinoides]|uniref:Fic family protein n=1 Tax=Secundilactobacillus paracollinoides TaxID=240427 RepID=UPI0009EA0926|nr:Fic family protein [Secundilactobacillus paracollinoides]